MNKSLNNFYSIFLILIIVQTISLAQIKIHKSISTEDGLVSNKIFTMFEDSKGYLWFGTDNGLSRWDGVKF